MHDRSGWDRLLVIERQFGHNWQGSISAVQRLPLIVHFDTLSCSRECTQIVSSQQRIASFALHLLLFALLGRFSRSKLELMNFFISRSMLSVWTCTFRSPPNYSVVNTQNMKSECRCVPKVRNEQRIVWKCMCSGGGSFQQGIATVRRSSLMRISQSWWLKKWKLSLCLPPFAFPYKTVPEISLFEMQTIFTLFPVHFISLRPTSILFPVHWITIEDLLNLKVALATLFQLLNAWKWLEITLLI